MTNWEKFKETFNIPQDAKVEPKDRICVILDCSEIKDCTYCPIAKKYMDLAMYWDDEYEEESKMTKEEAIAYVNAQLDKAVDDAEAMDDEMYDALQVLVKIAEKEK